MSGLRKAWSLAARSYAARWPKREGVSPHQVIYDDRWRLLRYRARPEGGRYGTPVLLIPSLLNRWYLLDLARGRSLVEYLVGEGHEVFCLDWGKPTREDRHLTFDEICDTRLGQAIAQVARRSAEDRVHLLGYCLGGTLAAIHAAARPQHVASLTALAAPVSFRDQGLLARWTGTRSFNPGLLVDVLGNVPWPVLQGAFHLLRPTPPISRAFHLVDRAGRGDSREGVLAAEIWGDGGVSFPGECFRTCMEELYRKDAFARGTFRLSGKPARMESIRCPVLAVTFEHDTIVPARSASLLLERVGSRDKERIHLPGGHVGAVMARSAVKTLWPRLSAFWAERDGGLAAQPVLAASVA